VHAQEGVTGTVGSVAQITVDHKIMENYMEVTPVEVM
jgi:hypothetical protein